MPPFASQVSRCFVFMLLALGMPCSIQIHAEPLPLDKRVFAGRLENGLRYYIQSNAKPEKRAELRLVVDAGSALEDDDQRGVAHLIEHLCFRGTEYFPNASLISRLQSLGSDFGPHVNASTSFDETLYRLSIPTDAPGALEDGLRILKDWAGGVDFSEENVNKEKKVVIEEWRIRLGASQRLLDKSLPVLYEGSRYSTRLPIGKKEILETASADTIRRFYTDWYRPDHLTVVVVGDVEPAAIEVRLRDLFSPLKTPAHARPRPDLSAPAPDGWTFSTANDPETGSSVVRVLFPRATVAIRTQADFERRLGEKLVVQSLKDRLAALRGRAPSPFQFAQASDGVSLARSRTELLLLALVGEGGIPAGLEALVTESERMRRHGLTEGEIQRGKRELLRAAQENLAEVEKRDSETVADAWIWHALRDQPVLPADWELEKTRAFLERVTAADIQLVINDLIRSTGGLVRVETPAKGGINPISVDSLKRIVDKAKSADMAAWTENAAPTSLLEKSPEPGTIVSRKEIASIGVTELILSNGAKVILKPTVFKQDEVLFLAFRSGGLSALPSELELAAKVLGGYVGESGLGQFSKADLSRYLTGRKVGLGLQIEPLAETFRGGSSSADLETLFQLLHLATGNPRRDEAAYQNVLALNRTFEGNVLLNPTLSFINDTIGWRYNEHPRVARLIQSPDAWKDLTLDKVIDAKKRRFGSVTGFTFLFVGSFSLESAVPLVEKYLASLPSETNVISSRDLGIRQVPGPLTRVAATATDPKAILLLYDEVAPAEWSMKDSHLAWAIGSILQRTLIDKLRIDQSNTYSLKVMSLLDKIPFPRYSLEIALPCAPDTVASSAAIIDAEIERIRSAGPSDDELQKEIENQRRTIQTQAESNGDWLWKLELIYKLDEGFTRVEHPETLIAWLTAEELKRVAKAYWRTNKWVRFELQPQPPTSK
ncbi:MAG: insulinase family protein [Opitutaceae bacterium]|nr:insulinase family protein [Opitutaceae bacterium]